MAIKLIVSLCLLLLADAVRLARCDNASFENCQSVDYDTIHAKKPVDQNFKLGPKGFYTNTESGCYVLDAEQPGFAVKYPALSEAYASAKSKFGSAAVNRPASACSDGSCPAADEAPATNCYEFCDPDANPDPCVGGCTCILDYIACTTDGCNDVWVCIP